MNLQLSLKTQWFEMTKSGVKTEDYREINPYWANRLFNKCNPDMSVAFWKGFLGRTGFDGERQFRYYGFSGQTTIDYVLKKYGFKPFEANTMTLGYPKSTDTDRILKYEHAGIEIREGNPDWGAEPGKLYFVIKHGKLIK